MVELWRRDARAECLTRSSWMISSRERRDRWLTILLAYLFITLPFAVSDWFPLLRVVNRSLFLAAGIIAAWSLFVKNRYRVRTSWSSLLALLLFLHMGLAIYRSDSTEMMWETVKENLNLFAVVALASWSHTVGPRFLPQVIIWTSAIYSVDVLIQRVVGVDLFGLQPFGERYWGVFSYGAPTFGVFISTVFFVPWFFLESKLKRVLVCVLYLAALLAASDRAPLVQLFLALVLFVPAPLILKLAFGGGLITGAYYLVWANPEWLPEKIRLLLDAVQLLIIRGPSDFLTDSATLRQLSLDAYLEKWVDVLSAWFTYDNVVNVVFGTGWGALPHVLRDTAGWSRPHSTYLELVISLGVIGAVVLTVVLLALWWRHPRRFLLLAPIVLPFAFFSVFSANWLFLSLMAYMMFVWAPSKRERSRTSAKRGGAGVRHHSNSRSTRPRTASGSSAGHVDESVRSDGVHQAD